MISWDLWAAIAIAVVASVYVMLFDQSPLMAVILIASALCAYFVIQTRIGRYS